MLKCITCSLCPLNQSMLFSPWTFHQTMAPSLGTESPSLCLSPTASPAGGRSLVSAPSYISLSRSRCTDLKSLGSFISSSLTSPPAQAQHSFHVTLAVISISKLSNVNISTASENGDSVLWEGDHSPQMNCNLHSSRHWCTRQVFLLFQNQTWSRAHAAPTSVQNLEIRAEAKPTNTCLLEGLSLMF